MLSFTCILLRVGSCHGQTRLRCCYCDTECYSSLCFSNGYLLVPRNSQCKDYDYQCAHTTCCPAAALHHCSAFLVVLYAGYPLCHKAQRHRGAAGCGGRLASLVWVCRTERYLLNPLLGQCSCATSCAIYQNRPTFSHLSPTWAHYRYSLGRCRIPTICLLSSRLLAVQSYAWSTAGSTLLCALPFSGLFKVLSLKSELDSHSEAQHITMEKWKKAT